ncbi:ABC transporter ATP-binding protein [Galactobacter caseinivorans]|nr:ABC transporter ATP-binding protein [Galactobacter caseinivorans]
MSLTKQPATGEAMLSAHRITVGYGSAPVLTDLDVSIPSGSFTAVIGPNACGKSTLLKALSRLLPLGGGSVHLAGRDAKGFKAKEWAKRVAMLPQSPVTPEAITVRDLVLRGRYAHQGLLRSYSREDERAVESAMASAGVELLAGRRVDELSGGQRQRVWIALVLAQESEVLLLDEPTTFLDLSHQVEVLELAAELAHQGRTVVAVLHEIGLAARYADHLIAMKAGAVVAQGTPKEVVTAQLLRDVFDLEAAIISDPDNGAPVVLPRTVVHRASK